jgi:hypothetical protein
MGCSGERSGRKPGRKLKWEEMDETERRMDTSLSFIEFGRDDEVLNIGELKELIDTEVKEHLYDDAQCRDVKILEIRARAGTLRVKFECDGRKYVAKWRYGWYCTYEASYSHLERVEE